jgi:hypothetical protein
MKLKKKLTLSLAILLFASVTLITTTFAWFSIAQDATVGDLSMEISGGTELLVSLDGINYHDNIDTDLLKQYLGDKLEVTHVTTIDQENYFSSYDNEQGVVLATKSALADGSVFLVIQGKDNSKDWYYSKEITEKVAIKSSDLKASSLQI